MKWPLIGQDAGHPEGRLVKGQRRVKGLELYNRGNCIVIPVFEEQFAVAWIAWSKGGEILGHIYAPLSTSELTVSRLINRNWDSPLLICRFGDLGIMRGAWRLLSIPDSAKRTWAIPEQFGTVFEAIHKAEIATAEPGHPDRVVARRSASVDEARVLPGEGLYGYRAVEIVVAALLTPLGAERRYPTRSDSNALFTESDFRKEPKKFRHWLAPGTVFALPLEDGNWMNGIVVQRSEGMVLVNFFGGKRPEPSASLDAPLVWSARIALGEWDYQNFNIVDQVDEIPPHLAVIPDFRRTIWAYPSGRYDFRVSYDPVNLEREVTCIRITQLESESLPPDWRLGGRGVAEVISRL
jgi:hypothetical protein